MRNEDRIPPPGKAIVFRKSKSRWSDPLLSSLTVSHFQEQIKLTGLSPPSPPNENLNQLIGLSDNCFIGLYV